MLGCAALVTALHYTGLIKVFNSDNKPLQSVAADTKTVPKQIVSQKRETMIDQITGIEFVHVPAGCHEFCVDDFWIGKYEVTQGQWVKIMNRNPSEFKKGEVYPVEKISWNETQEFFANLNKMNKKIGYQYRLPTVAEWNYACHAGSSGQYCGGDDQDAVAWWEGNSSGSTHPVGEKLANAFGIHDMSGNVGEWCLDWSGEYPLSSQRNPTGPKSGKYRIHRGGSWNSHCQLKGSSGAVPYASYNSIGFRCVLAKIKNEEAISSEKPEQ